MGVAIGRLNYSVHKIGSVAGTELGLNRSIKNSTGSLLDGGRHVGDVLERLTHGYTNRFNFDKLPLEVLEENNALDRFYWIHDIAVTSEVLGGPNRNRDGFPGKEDKSQGLGLAERYGTFVGAGVFDDHNSEEKYWDLERGHVFGVVLDAALIEHPQLGEGASHVETLMLVDIPMLERVRPGTTAQIDAGIIQDTSMGCLASHTTCSKCGKTIYDVTMDACEHLRNKQQKLEAGQLAPGIYERIWNPYFFENTIVTSGALTNVPGGGADVNAKMKGAFDQINLHPAVASPLNLRRCLGAFEQGDLHRRIYSVLDKYSEDPVSRFMQEWATHPRQQMSLHALGECLKKASCRHSVSLYIPHKAEEVTGKPSSIFLIGLEDMPLPLDAEDGAPDIENVLEYFTDAEETADTAPEAPEDLQFPREDWIEDLELPLEE